MADRILDLDALLQDIHKKSPRKPSPRLSRESTIDELTKLESVIRNTVEMVLKEKLATLEAKVDRILKILEGDKDD